MDTPSPADPHLRAGLGPFAAARLTGVPYAHAKYRAKKLGCRAFAQPHAENWEALEARRHARRDQRFCAAVMALGGMPRAVVLDGRTLWLGPDGRPWSQNKP